LQYRGAPSGAPLGYSPALLANIRPGKKTLPGTSTLAYYEYLYITDVKSFIALGSDVSVRFLILFIALSVHIISILS
jgi:hypothetical protein